MIRPIASTRQIALWIGFFLPFALAIVIQMQFERWYGAYQRDVQVPFVPSPAVVERFSFGFKNFAADFFWLEAIQYTVRWFGRNDALPRYLDVATSLDPRFKYPYLFTGLVIPDKRWGYMEETRRIMERGMQALPDDWEIPFYLATAFHIHGRNTDEALRYITIAAAKPGAPDVVKRSQAIYAARVGDLASARAFFITIQETAESEYSRNVSADWLKRLDVLDDLQRRIFTYRDRYGKIPDSLGELRRVGLWQRTPPELVGFEIRVQQKTGVIQFMR